MPVRALKLGLPSRVEINNVHDAGHETYARAVTHRFHFPAEGSRVAVNLIYYTGNEDMPPKPILDAVRGTLVTFLALALSWKALTAYSPLDSGTRSATLSSKMTRSSLGTPSMGTPPASRSRSRAFATISKNGRMLFSAKARPLRPLSWAQLTEIGLSGIVALKLQNNLDWDGPAMKARGLPEASNYVNKKNRKEWL